MEHYKRGSHTVWDLNYHIVWTTKYRYKVLAGDVGLRTRELLREIARSQEMVIHAGSVHRDHVHLLISPSRFSDRVGRCPTTPNWTGNAEFVFNAGHGQLDIPGNLLDYGFAG